MFTIGQVAEQAGVAASAIRYYEREGLLPEPERIGGQRRYNEDAVRRLEVIGVAKRAGFSLDDVACCSTRATVASPPTPRFVSSPSASCPRSMP